MKLEISKEDIARVSRVLGTKITRDLVNTEVPLLVIGVLTGSIYFLADLTRQIDLTIQLDFIRVSSYINNTKVSEPIIVQDISVDIEGRDILVVEDIIDTGDTIRFLKENFKSRGAKSVRVASLLKRVNCKEYVQYVGYNLSDEKYVVGYGLDNNSYMRNLKDIYTLEDGEDSRTI